MVIVLEDKIITTKKGIIRQYQDSGIRVVVEIPIANEQRDKDRIDDIKKMLNSELLLQINN